VLVKALNQVIGEQLSIAQIHLVMDFVYVK